jgi:hypothetical protein
MIVDERDLDPDSLEIDDSDGKLHLYVCAAIGGERWAGQLVFTKDQMNQKEFKWQGGCLIDATIRSLLKNKIISM